MLSDALRKWNPWWADREELHRFTGIKRTILPALTQAGRLPHIKDVIGIRRSGKTTVLYQVIESLFSGGVSPKEILFLNYDDPEINSATFREIEEEAARISPSYSYLFIDEAQQKTGWESYVRTLYDTKAYKQIYVTGSSSTLLSQDMGRTLTGRHATYTLYPFSFREALSFQGWENYSLDYLEKNKNILLHHLDEYLRYGGFPETLGKTDLEKRMIHTNTYNDILSRDVCSRHNASYEIVKRISAHLMTNVGREYSYRSISRAASVDVETAERYVAYLNEAYLTSTLELFTYKTKERHRQNKKSYAIDTGLRNSVSFSFSADAGRIMENAVYVELLRRGKETYYWKNDKGQEVDFLTWENAKCSQLIQACQDAKETKTMQREEKSLAAAMNALGQKTGTIITEKEEKTKNIPEGEIRYVPLWKWLLEKDALW
jgi:hypothetical protein